MPESPRMVPLYAARVSDLRIGRSVLIRCRVCKHEAEASVVLLRDMLSPHEFVKDLGRQFRCTACKQRGKVIIDARHALGYTG